MNASTTYVEYNSKAHSAPKAFIYKNLKSNANLNENGHGSHYGLLSYDHKG
jgi:hypothetical protein